MVCACHSRVPYNIVCAEQFCPAHEYDARDKDKLLHFLVRAYIPMQQYKGIASAVNPPNAAGVKN